MEIVEALKDPRRLREKLGLSQKEFWGRVQISQSGGSRYEAGRRLPPPVRELNKRIYFRARLTTVVKREDTRREERCLADFIRKNNASLYRRYLQFRRQQARQTRAVGQRR
jgi:transcriptional regulator with XRE-family HTH domain